MYSSYAVATAVFSVVFPVLASLAVLLRLRAREIKSLSYGTDDYTVIAALCLSISLACMVLYGAFKAGIGQLLSTMTPAQFTNYQKHLYFVVILAHLAMGMVKISVLSLYKRIFAVRNFHRSANVTMGFVIIWILGSFFTQVFSAWPISNWWNFQGHYTINYGAFLTAFAAMDILLDIVILISPIPIIKSLHMSPRRKWTLGGVFGLGFFCVIAASVRLYFAYELSSGTDRHPTDDHFSYISVNNVIWSEIEPCASIIAACLPTFGPLIQNGISLQSLAKSLHSHIFKHSTSSSTTDTERLASSGWTAPHIPRLREWKSIEDESSTKVFTGDIELGKTKALERGDPAIKDLPRANGAWNQHDQDKTISDARHVDVGRQEQDSDSNGIRIEKSFASETEQL